MGSCPGKLPIISKIISDCKWYREQTPVFEYLRIPQEFILSGTSEPHTLETMFCRNFLPGTLRNVRRDDSCNRFKRSWVTYGNRSSSCTVGYDVYIFCSDSSNEWADFLGVRWTGLLKIDLHSEKHCESSAAE
eukprot:1189799-Prorocentrum_minimum.AAC.1